MVRLLEVSGAHYPMGWQHGYQVRDLRPLILEAIQNRLASIEGKEGLAPLMEGLLETLREIGGSPTLEMIRGQAHGLPVGFQRLFQYDMASYLEDNLFPSDSEGCSTWAASEGATSSGEPILVKNRDYYLEHLPLQIVVRAEPEGGRRCAYGYLCVGSAGSPGVFGSGINQRGLCVADTRVRSLDNGPGLPAYSLMMQILEQHESVRSALEYLKGAKRMGGSNLVLADAQGDLAVFEVGYRNYGIIEADDHIVVNTNSSVPTWKPNSWTPIRPKPKATLSIVTENWTACCEVRMAESAWSWPSASWLSTEVLWTPFVVTSKSSWGKRQAPSPRPSTCQPKESCSSVTVGPAKKNTRHFLFECKTF
jgi:hypothetical protein